MNIKEARRTRATLGEGRFPGFARLASAYVNRFLRTVSSLLPACNSLGVVQVGKYSADVDK